VEDQKIFHFHRLQGRPPVTLDPPSPLVRCRLHQEGSFEAIGPHETVPETNPREYFPTPDKSTISYLDVEGFRIANLPITDLSMPLLIQIVPPNVTSPER